MYVCMYVCICLCSLVFTGPDEAPQNVEVIKYRGGILVTWLPPPRETRNGPLTGYIVSLLFYNMCLCYITVMFVCAQCVCVCVSVCLSACVYVRMCVQNATLCYTY